MSIKEVNPYDLLEVCEAVFFLDTPCIDDIVAFTGFSDTLTKRILFVTQLLEITVLNEDGIYELKSTDFDLVTGAQGEAKQRLFYRCIKESPYLLFMREQLLIYSDRRKAARRTRAKFNLQGSEEAISHTFTELLIFTFSLKNNNNRFVIPSYETTINEIAGAAVEDLMSAKAYILGQLNSEIPDLLGSVQVEKLADAVLKAQQGEYATAVRNATYVVEKFLVDRLTDNNLDVDGGIISKAERLAENNLLYKKMLGYYNFLGQLRNAADHASDTDIAPHEWQITKETCMHAIGLSIQSINIHSSHLDNKFVL